MMLRKAAFAEARAVGSQDRGFLRAEDDKMIFDCRDERHGVWRQLRPGAHQLVSATLEAQPALFELLSDKGQCGPALNLAADLIVRFTSNCIGQLAKAQSMGCSTDCRLDPSGDDTCVMRKLGAHFKSEIALEISQDIEFLTFWNGIWEDGLSTQNLKGELLSWADYVGVIRIATRMAGCCIGQALAHERLSIFSQTYNVGQEMNLAQEPFSA